MAVEAKDPSYIKEIAQIMTTHALTKVIIRETPDSYAEIVLEKSSPVDSACLRGAHMPMDQGTEPGMEAGSAAVSSLTDVASPMVGVFYTSPSPDADPFVRIGDNVKKGDVLCILEAMKLMNEIQAEKDCKIVDICMKNGDLVEFGQVLFKVDDAI